MPTYEYVCSACTNEWEEIQKISEDPIQVCPKCGQSTAKRQISGGNFILKGGGWYADLYSSTPKKAGEGKGEAKAESKGEGGGGASKESAAAPAVAAPAAAAPSGSSGSSDKP